MLSSAAASSVVNYPLSTFPEPPPRPSGIHGRHESPIHRLIEWKSPRTLRGTIARTKGRASHVPKSGQIRSHYHNSAQRNHGQSTHVDRPACSGVPVGLPDDGARDAHRKDVHSIFWRNYLYMGRSHLDLPHGDDRRLRARRQSRRPQPDLGIDCNPVHDLVGAHPRSAAFWRSDHQRVLDSIEDVRYAALLSALALACLPAATLAAVSRIA